MYAWGLVGYVGGVLAEAGAFKRADGSVARLPLLAYGFLSCVMYGAVINCYDVIGFVQPLTWAGVVARVAASLPFDVMHGVANGGVLGGALCALGTPARPHCAPLWPCGLGES